jgi:hypothetical protein
MFNKDRPTAESITFQKRVYLKKFLSIFLFLFGVQNIQKKSDKGYLFSRTGLATHRIVFNVYY